MEGIRIRRCGPLAARPMTLRLLLDVYEEQGTFPKSQKELYEQACLLLCEKEESQSDHHLDGEVRLQIASHIAAVMLLTNVVTVIDQPSTFGLLDGEISIRQLTSDSKRVARQTLSVTRDEIKEALNTGLFSPLDASRFTWFHRSIAEYLTARYLAKSAMPQQQIMQLLQHPADPAHRIVPHFHAVAAWYTSFERDAFQYLSENDPDVLLNADLGVASSEERSGLVDALIASAEKMGWQRLNATSILRNLAFPGIAERLASVIRDDSSSRDARWLAIDIAKAVDCVPGTEGSLLSVILDPIQEMVLRVHCAYVVASNGTDHAKQQLVPLALVPNVDDSQDELKGCALRAAWPDALSTEQLFQALTPVKDPNLFGAYSFFLDQLAKDLHFEDGDVLLALRWAMSNRAFRFGDIIEAIKRRAWAVMEQPLVAETYAQLAVSEIHQMSHLEHGGDDEQFIALVAGKRNGRRAVVQHLVSLLQTPPNAVTWILHGRPSLLDFDDFDWLLDRLSESDFRDQSSWIALVQQMTYFGVTAMIETIFERCETLPALRDAFPFSTDLTNPDIQKVRADWYESERLRKELDQRLAERERLKPDIARGIATLLDRIEGGDYERYWSLDSLLATTDGNARTLGCDFRRLSPWNESDESTRSRILDAAHRYVLGYDDHAIEGWLGTNTIDWRAIAGFRALYLLWEERRQTVTNLESEVWHRWAAAVVGCPFNAEGEMRSTIQDLFSLAYRNTPDQMVAALEKQITYEVGNGYIPVIEHLAKCWDERLEQYALAHALDVSTPTGCVDQMLEQLYMYRPETTEHVLCALVRVPPPVEDGERQQMKIASRLLLARSPSVWSDVFRAIQMDDAFARALVEDLASYGHNATLALPENALADLYIWLATHYPHREDPNEPGAHFVGIRERIATWRDVMLQNLANLESVASYEAIRHITESLPDLPWLRHYLWRAEFATLNHTWRPLLPEDLLTYFMDAQSRIVRSAEQLMNVLIESLERLNKKMQTRTPLAQFLWHPDGENTWRPQIEAYLSDFIRSHLDYDIIAQKVIINREVEIMRGSDRLDITVDAIALGDRDEQRQVTVIIEVKGSWNEQLFTSMRDQLVQRYLTHNDSDAGIYAVGWYQCAQWKGNRYRTETLEGTRTKLTQQANELSKEGKMVRAVVLDARFPSSSATD